MCKSLLYNLIYLFISRHYLLTTQDNKWNYCAILCHTLGGVCAQFDDQLADKDINSILSGRN